MVVKSMLKSLVPRPLWRWMRQIVKPATFRARLLHAVLPWRRRGKQIFICGYPRSGTSLLYNMLSASLEEFEFGEFEQSALRAIRQPGNSASKRPNDIYEVDRIVEANIHWKRVLCIIVIRDLRDIVTSIHPNVPNDYYCSYGWRWEPQPQDRLNPKRNDRGIGSIHQAIGRAKAVRGIKCLVVRYEDLVADPDQVQRQIGDLLALTFSRPFSAFAEVPERHAYRYAGERSPLDARYVRENESVDRSRHGKWRRPEHFERIRAEFEAHPQLFELLRKYGYEKDDSWFEEYRSGTESRKQVKA